MRRERAWDTLNYASITVSSSYDLIFGTSLTLRLQK